MRSYHTRHSRRSGRNEGGLWLSFSDLMSSLLLIIILVLFYIIYQYFDMYEVNMAEIARRQYDLDVANASIDDAQTRLTAQEQQIIRQQQELDTARANLDDAQALLDQQRTDLENTQALLQTREDELDALGVQLTDQQAMLEAQALQIEQLVGLKPRIITDLSEALRAANIAAAVDPRDGSIALASDVLFSKGEYRLTEEGQRSIDAFLGVYLDVLFSEDYLPYIAEVIIEGHTDSDGDYISNLDLSQRRAGAVAAYVLSDSYAGISPAQKERLRQVVTANGRSWSQPILDAYGNEDQDASRRVVFKFRLTDENMIDQLRSILESENAPLVTEGTQTPAPTAAPTATPTVTPTIEPTAAPTPLLSTKEPNPTTPPDELMED